MRSELATQVPASLTVIRLPLTSVPERCGIQISAGEATRKAVSVR